MTLGARATAFAHDDHDYFTTHDDRVDFLLTAVDPKCRQVHAGPPAVRANSADASIRCGHGDCDRCRANAPHHLVIISTLAVGCADNAPDEDLKEVQAPPTAAEVQGRLTATYRHPEKHELVATTDDAGVITWKRKYDGIEVLTDGKSALERDQWVTRFIPELAEPPVVAKADLITFEAAAAKVGIENDLRTGVATAHYVYKPVFVERPNKPVVTNAIDVDRFIEKYILSVEIEDEADKTITFVDAMTSAVLSRNSRERSIVSSTTLEVPTYNLSWVPLDVTADHRGKFDVTYTFQDMKRCSLVYPWMGTTRCLNGQGVLHWRDFPPDPSVRLEYEDLFVTDEDPNLAWENDVAFALNQSWTTS